MIKSFSRVRPVLPEIVLSSMLILWAIALLVTEGAIKLYDGKDESVANLITVVASRGTVQVRINGTNMPS